MKSLAPFLFVLAGAVAGTLQSKLLAGTLRRGKGGFGPLGRLLFVGAVLFVAARAGHLGAAAAGWLAAFALTGALQYRRLR